MHQRHAKHPNAGTALFPTASSATLAHLVGLRERTLLTLGRAAGRAPALLTWLTSRRESRRIGPRFWSAERWSPLSDWGEDYVSL